MNSLVQSLFTRKTLAIVIGVLIAQAFVLTIFCQPWWCRYGIGLWANIKTHCLSQNMLDIYSLSHVLHGVLFYGFLFLVARKQPIAWRFCAAVALEASWEILENTPWVINRYRNETASLDYIGDSVLNSFFDTICAAAGFVFSARFSWKASLALIVAFELIALWAARDNLALNILMLIAPIDAIKEWQLGA